MHTVTTAKGKTRATHIGDARKRNLVGSVTGIISMMAAPALENWKLNQLAETIMAEPWRSGDTYHSSTEKVTSYIERMKRESQKYAKEAAKEGTRIHEAVENHYKGKQYNSDYNTCVKAVTAAIQEEFGERDWISEKTFAHPLGYGGTCDLYCIDGKSGEGENLPPIVLDIKGKEFTEDKMPIKGYSSHALQLSACAYGLGIPGAIRANVFVSRTNHELVSIYTHDNNDQAWRQFQACLELWKVFNKYNSEWEEK